jgi:hypothetical protein
MLEKDIKRGFITCTLQYNYNDQIKEDEMDRTCSTNDGEDECM